MYSLGISFLRLGGAVQVSFWKYGTKYSRMDQVKFFEGYLPQNLLSPLLNTLFYIFLLLKQTAGIMLCNLHYDSAANSDVFRYRLCGMGAQTVSKHVVGFDK